MAINVSLGQFAVAKERQNNVTTTLSLMEQAGVDLLVHARALENTTYAGDVLPARVNRRFVAPLLPHETLG